MRFGLVGLGRAAQTFHVPALRRVAGADIVGGADSSPERRASWEADTGTPAYSDLDELVEQTRPEVLVVATPPDSHAELCLRAFEHGLDVFCEKPFMPSVADADRVLDAAAAAGRRVAVNHEFREKPIFRAITDGVASGRYGRLVFCQVWQLMDLAPWEEPTAWRADMARRTLLEGGVHLVDLLVQFFGELPEAVYARHSAGFHDDPDADAIQLLTLEFSQGRLGQLTIDRLCPAATRYIEVRADCENASLRASLGGRALLQLGKKRAEKTGFRFDLGAGGLAWTERGLERTTLARAPRNAGTEATAALLEKVVAALRSGSEPPSSGREARDVLAIIEAAYESAASGRRVDVARPRTAVPG
jgi:predicted dehydrogenase